MKSFVSFRLGHVLGFCALFAPGLAFAQPTVTINLTAGTLYNSTGNTVLADGDLMLLVADTGSNGFGSFLSGSNLSAGNFLNGDDQIIGVTTIGHGGGGPGIAIQSFPNIPLGTAPYTNLDPGDPLAVVWVTSSGTVLNSGESYGLFTGTSADSNTGSPWAIPAAGLTIDLNFQTISAGGSQPESAGEANLTAVPEPSTYALIAGVAALLAGVVHARRSPRRSEVG